MDDVQIVEIDPELDVPACADVFVAAFAADPWNGQWPVATVRKRLAEVLARPGSLGLAAVVDGECVGFVVGYVESFHPSDRFQLAGPVFASATWGGERPDPWSARSSRGQERRRGLRHHRAR